MNFSCSLYEITLKSDEGFLLNIKLCGLMSLLLSIPTILLNTPLMIVLLKNRERSKPYNLFLLNLVITDCLCGYFVLPFHSAFFLQISQNQDPCSYSKFRRPFNAILGTASFLSIFAITIERYTAVFYPFFYERKVNIHTTVASIITIWILSFASFIPSMATRKILFYQVCIAIVGIILPIFNFYCYFKILTHTRRIRNEITSTRRRLGSQSNRRESSLALTGVLLLVSMCICYYPLVIRATITASGVTSSISDYLQCWTWNLTSANSCFNAFITCYQLSHLRRAVLKLWRCKKANEIEAAVQPPIPRNHQYNTGEVNQHVEEAV